MAATTNAMGSQDVNSIGLFKDTHLSDSAMVQVQMSVVTVTQRIETVGQQNGRDMASILREAGEELHDATMKAGQ